MSKDDVITNLLNDGQRLFEELQLIGKHILFFRKKYGKKFEDFASDSKGLPANSEIKQNYENWQACIKKSESISRKYRDNLRKLRKCYEELDILKEFSKELSREYGIALHYKKIKEDRKCQPDFECRFENGEICFVELTKMLCAGGKTKAKNLFYQKLEKKLKISLQRKGYNNLDILIKPNYFSKKFKDDEIEVFILEFTMLLKLYCKSYDNFISIDEDRLRIMKFKLLNSFVKQIIIWKSDRLKVEISKWFTDPGYLIKEIENTIKRKSNKSYNRSPLWLLIYIDDTTTNAEVIKNLIANKAFESLELEKCKFDRIYLQLSYCPDIKRHPAFRIK